MMEVTINVFSGRPDPTWMMDDAAARPILRDIIASPSIITPPLATSRPLGFRGILLTLSDGLAKEAGLPSVFRIAGGTTAVSKEALAVARRIIDAMPLLGSAAPSTRLTPLTPQLRTLLHGELEGLSGPTGGELRLEEPPPQPATETPMIDGNCRYEATPFDPASWNNPAHVYDNNCYNFGTNRRWDNYAQPGRGGGVPASPPFTCQNVTAGAFADGLRLRGQGPSARTKPRWFIALAVRPDGWDYHWWRQCTAYWAHKPGGTDATNLDARGQIIYNPETCDRGSYTVFCGYFYVPRHINLAS